MAPSENDINLAVGDYFRRAREALGWTLQDVSDRAKTEGAKISLSALSRIERGMTGVSLAEAIAICRALGTPLQRVAETARHVRNAVPVDLSSTDFDSLFGEGKRLIRRGDMERARSFFEAAIDWIALQDDTHHFGTKKAEALIWAAESYRRQRSFHMCADLSSQVLNLSESTEDQRTRALTQQIAVAYMTRDFFRAKLVAEAVEQRLDVAEEQTRAFALGTIAALHIKLGDYGRALPYLREAHGVYEKQGDEFQLARSQATIGFCLGMTECMQEGIALLECACETATARGFLYVAIFAYLSLGRLRIQAHDWDHAREEFDTAAGFARKLSRHDDLFQCWYEIWKLEQERSNEHAAAHARTVLSRLLRRVDPSLEEVTEFLAAIGDENGRGEE